MIKDVFQAKKRIFVSENKMLLETNCSRLEIVDVTLGHICFKKLDSQFVENLFPADFFLFFN